MGSGGGGGGGGVTSWVGRISGCFGFLFCYEEVL